MSLLLTTRFFSFYLSSNTLSPSRWLCRGRLQLLFKRTPSGKYGSIWTPTLKFRARQNENIRVFGGDARMHRRGRARWRLGRLPVRRLRQRGCGHQRFRLSCQLQNDHQQHWGESNIAHFKNNTIYKKYVGRYRCEMIGFLEGFFYSIVNGENLLPVHCSL